MLDIHETIIVVARSRPARFEDEPAMPDVDAFRAEMPAELRHLVVGPIPSAVNGWTTFVFAPDGHSWTDERWEVFANWRRRFVALFHRSWPDGGSPFEVIAIRHGGDYRDMHGGAVVTHQFPRAADPLSRYADDDRECPCTGG